MKKKAIVIGAGQIGRGFIGQTLSDSGYEVVFLDAVEKIINDINKFKEYEVIILGEENKKKMVKNVRAVLSSNVNAKEEFLDADIVATAVGPNIIPRVAPVIAEGIKRRKEKGVMKPLTVVACENMDSGSTKLYNCVKELLNEEELQYCEQYVGFPDAEVSRIVVPIECMDPLTVKVEKYMEWIVDKAKVKGDLSDVKGLVLSEYVEAYVRRKIFTLTGHAMLGYLGYEKGYRYIWQAVYDSEIFQIVYRALEECGQAWSKEYKMPLEEFMEYSALMLVRFADQRIKDACTRPCREPIRKLAISERFFGPALAAIEYGIEPKYIIKGIQSVLNYDYAEDKEAVELQTRLQKYGINETLVDITGLDAENKLLKMIVQ